MLSKDRLGFPETCCKYTYLTKKKKELYSQGQVLTDQLFFRRTSQFVYGSRHLCAASPKQPCCASHCSKGFCAKVLFSTFFHLLDKLCASFPSWATCRSWAPSPIWAVFAIPVIIFPKSCFPLPPCCPCPVPVIAGWRNWIQACEGFSLVLLWC